MKPVYKKWFGGMAIVFLFSSYIAYASASNQTSQEESFTAEIPQHVIAHPHQKTTRIAVPPTVQAESNSDSTNITPTVVESETNRTALQSNENKEPVQSDSIEQSKPKMKPKFQTQPKRDSIEPNAKLEKNDDFAALEQDLNAQDLSIRSDESDETYMKQDSDGLNNENDQFEKQAKHEHENEHDESEED